DLYRKSFASVQELAGWISSSRLALKAVRRGNGIWCVTSALLGWAGLIASPGPEVRSIQRNS
ncbi:MAG: hypothetical protein ACRD10_08910, partial [Terriglobia bacterium]